MNQQTKNSIKIYTTAKRLIGVAIASNQELGCAQTVNRIFKKAIGKEIGGGASTSLMYTALQDGKKFTKCDVPLPGDVIISPTGKGNGKMLHGHVGIVAKNGILSNSSEDGRLHENYTLDTWRKIFHNIGGFVVEYYRVL